MKYKSEKGQVSIEFIFLISISIILSIAILNFIASESEIDIALLAGKNGINEGIIIDSSAIYPTNTFNEYSLEKPNLLKANSIKLDKITIRNSQFDLKYNKTRIQLQVYVISDVITEKKDQDSLGDRINYNLRKSISQTFNTENLSNSLYNPSYSKNYIFTTADVVWIK